jgi:hypothetical protein
VPLFFSGCNCGIKVKKKQNQKRIPALDTSSIGGIDREYMGETRRVLPDAG